MKKRIIIIVFIILVGTIGLFFVSCDLVKPIDPDHNGVDVNCPLPWCHHKPGPAWSAGICENNLIKTTPYPNNPTD